ncbi:WD40/YVTN/BNR-like repeat-containing protein [Legionella drancourtii]|uniref:NHL repeat protein n=1 Tax=Legionella drancourtii LLAP12 TaxID=658187 RepID=G9EUG9_9GAMM|nr:hypothetical protein [Legionella drancourtii]EHL28969.1 hypothetical protein LDG_8963 [Legionella drancourtii LLAP12]
MNRIIRFFTVFLMPALVFAGTPLFTITPLTPTTIQVPLVSAFTIQYVVQNQSAKPHTLIMKPINGITQVTSAGNCPNPVVLGAKQSCTLTLIVNGAQISGAINEGPQICQQGPNGKPNPQLCYQPSQANALHVSTMPITQIFYSGAQNGTVYYSFNNGATWIAITPPGNGSPIDSIFATTNNLYAGAANGFIYYTANNGMTWSATSSPDSSSVNSVFSMTNTLYAGTTNGFVYYSTNNGTTWNQTSSPDGSSITAVFATTHALYAGTENGSVFYSINNGASWIAINGQPDGSAIQSIFVANNTLFINTANEYSYSSSSLTGGGIWTAFAQSVYSLFVNSAGNLFYGGTQSGYVYSITDGTELGFITYTPINSVFVLGS